MKFQSLFGASGKVEQSPGNISIANGSVAERRIVNGVKLKNYEQKTDELPTGTNKVKRESSISLHSKLLGHSKKDAADGKGLPIPLGNGVVLRNMPKIRRPHSKVSSMPVIEKISLEPNVRHSLASVQESPHENQEKFEEIVRKYLEQIQEDAESDPMRTPVRKPTKLHRSQSCRSEKTLNRIRKGSIATEASVSPYKNYTLTTPRRRGVQKKKMQAMRRKSIHANLAEGMGPEVLLRHVEELKEKRIDSDVVEGYGADKALLKSSKSAK